MEEQNITFRKFVKILLRQFKLMHWSRKVMVPFSLIFTLYRWTFTRLTMFVLRFSRENMLKIDSWNYKLHIKMENWFRRGTRSIPRKE